MTRKEHFYIQNKAAEQILYQQNPDYQGRVGKAVIDLGIILRMHTEAILNKTKRIDDTIKVVKRIQTLGLPVRENKTLSKLQAKAGLHMVQQSTRSQLRKLTSCEPNNHKHSGPRNSPLADL